MRLASTLTCAAALSVAACGQDSEPLPPSFATAQLWCTKTTAGTLASCLREKRFEPTLDEGVPVEASMVFRIVMRRGGEIPPAP